MMVVLAFVSTNVMALNLDWQFSPDSNQVGEPTTSVWWADDYSAPNWLVIGLENTYPDDPFDSAPLEDDDQPEGVYGVGALLPTLAPGTWFEMSFDWLFQTWDSYNDPEVTGIDTQPNDEPVEGTGWWDSFSVTITKGGYYWDMDLTDPINTDPDIEELFVLEGGTSYGDEYLESYSGPTTMFTYVPPDDGDYYLNFILDTKTNPDSDTAYPSWGVFSDITVEVVPEPSTMLLLGVGLIGLFALGRKKFSKK
jgi:hypothetical protein